MDVYNVGPDELDGCFTIFEPDGSFATLDWLVYCYEQGSYDGSGEAVGYINGKLYCTSLGHCSCYGPWDNAIDEYSVVDFWTDVKCPISDQFILDKVEELLKKVPT